MIDVSDRLRAVPHVSDKDRAWYFPFTTDSRLNNSSKRQNTSVPRPAALSLTMCGSRIYPYLPHGRFLCNAGYIDKIRQRCLLQKYEDLTLSQFLDIRARKEWYVFFLRETRFTLNTRTAFLE